MNKKKIIILAVIIILILVCVFVYISKNNEKVTSSVDGIEGTIVVNGDNAMVSKPVYNESQNKTDSNVINKDTVDGIDIDTTTIVVKEYPLIVKINGNIYCDSGITESNISGTVDGTITTMVNREEVPSNDNESNFGININYQYYEDDIILMLEDGNHIFRKR